MLLFALVLNTAFLYIFVKGLALYGDSSHHSSDKDRNGVTRHPAVTCCRTDYTGACTLGLALPAPMQLVDNETVSRPCIPPDPAHFVPVLQTIVDVI